MSNRRLLVLVVLLTLLTTTNLKQLLSMMMGPLFPVLLSVGYTTILRLQVISQKMCRCATTVPYYPFPGAYTLV